MDTRQKKVFLYYDSVENSVKRKAGENVFLVIENNNKSLRNFTILNKIHGRAYHPETSWNFKHKLYLYTYKQYNKIWLEFDYKNTSLKIELGDPNYKVHYHKTKYFQFFTVESKSGEILLEFKYWNIFRKSKNICVNRDYLQQYARSYKKSAVYEMAMKNFEESIFS